MSWLYSVRRFIAEALSNDPYITNWNEKKDLRTREQRLDEMEQDRKVEEFKSGHFWIGNLSGFQIASTTDDAKLELTHRCGWYRTIPNDEYVGNIVEYALLHDVCLPHYPRR